MLMVDSRTPTIVHLNRRGRRRKAGPRNHGRLVPSQDVRGVVLDQPHRKWLQGAADGRLDQKAESPLGRLNLAGHVSDAQLEAGKRMAKVVARYRVVLDSWDPTRGRSDGPIGPSDRPRVGSHESRTTR